MNIQDYIIALGLAAAGATVLLAILWLVSLISWGLIFAILLGILVPVAYKAVNFWKEKNCWDLDDFFTALFEREEENISSNSICDDESPRSNWH